MNLENYMPGWQIVRQIGAGSFGKVYEIRKDEKNGQGGEYRSALKVISIPPDSEQYRHYRDDGINQTKEKKYETIFVGNSGSTYDAYPSGVRRGNGCV